MFGNPRGISAPQQRLGLRHGSGRLGGQGASLGFRMGQQFCHRHHGIDDTGTQRDFRRKGLTQHQQFIGQQLPATHGHQKR